MKKLAKALTVTGVMAMMAGTAWAGTVTNPVPEINASAGLLAAAVLITVAAIVREMFTRRRAQPD